MAKRPVFVCFGNSNAEAFASLTNVPVAAMTRWTGAAFPSTYPISVTIPGVQVWTPRMPYDVPDSRTITNSGAATVTFSGAVQAAAQQDQWVYIKSVAAGQGQFRQMTGAGVGTNTATVTPAWSPAISTSGTLEFLTGSHTVAAGSSTTVINKTANTVAFTGSEGKWVVVMTGASVNQHTKIVTVNSATQITCFPPLTVAPSAGDGICVLQGTGAVDTLTNLTSANGAIQDMTFALDGRPVYGTGFDYPNWYGFPWQSPLIHKGLYRINFLPELGWQLRQKLAQKPLFISIAAPTSTLSPNYIGTTLQSSTFSWSHDVTHKDYHPSSSTSLYTALTSAITAAAVDIGAAGDTVDIQGFFSVIAEVDSNLEPLADAIETNMRLLRDSLRQFASDNLLSSKKASEIPWCMAGVGSSLWAFRSTANTALQAVADEDPFSGYLDTTTSDFTYEVDGIHYNANGQIALGVGFADLWSSILTEASDAARALNELPTLQTIRTAVVQRYERTGASADARTVLLNQFINDSLREVYNTLGDNAPFLRRTATLTASDTFPSALTLPYPIKRLLRIENSLWPGRQVDWKGLSLTEGGRVQIVLHDYSGGPFIAHFIAIPKDLVKDDDVTLVPQDYVELVVMLTCKRLAESVGNSTIAVYYAAESDRLWRYVKKDAYRYGNMAQESMTDGGYDTCRNAGFSDPTFWNL